MKKLNEIKLNNFSEMNNVEMKTIVGGGSGVAGGSDCVDLPHSCNGPCSVKFGETVIFGRCEPIYSGAYCGCVETVM